MRAILCFAVLIAAISGCNHVKPDSTEPNAVLNLATVVEAVQYAIDNTASDDAWSATKKEKKHCLQGNKSVKVNAMVSVPL